MAIDWAMHIIRAAHGAWSLLLAATNIATETAPTNNPVNVADGAAPLAPIYGDMILFFSVPGLFFLMLGLGRWLKRKHSVRLNYWAYFFFSLCLAVYFPAELFDQEMKVKIFAVDFSLRVIFGAFACVLGSVFVMALVDRYIWDLYFKQRHRVKVPKFVSEVVSLTILAISVVLVLALCTKLDIKGVFLAPGVLAVFVGLAMQDLLANIIAGLALQFGKSFKDGDWLWVGDKYAQVIDINWRSTRFRTIDDIAVDIPNRDLSKMTIINLNLPQRLHAMRISVNVDYGAPPTRVKDVLLHATSNAKGVSPEPRPCVFLKNFGDYAVEYDIKFWMEDHNEYNDVSDAIRTNIWYSFQRHGIKIPFPIRNVQIERASRTKEQEIQNTARIMLRQQPLFKSLTDDQLDALLPRGRLVHFGRGEKVIQQGEEGASMFILVSGEANVVVERNSHPVHVASLRGGDCFGEMSLLTGERRTATILAHTDCEVVEIGKSVLQHSLKEYPDLLNKLSALLAKRQMETEGIVAANTKPHEVEATQIQYTNKFVDKLRVFFEL